MASKTSTGLVSELVLVVIIQSDADYCRHISGYTVQNTLVLSYICTLKDMTLFAV